MVNATADSANNNTKLVTSNRTGRRTTATATRFQERRVRPDLGSPMPRWATSDSTGGSSVTVANNPTSTAIAQAGPSPENTESRADNMARNANATVAAEGRMTRPMLAVA